jgi:hypothetical protein
MTIKDFLKIKKELLTLYKNNHYIYNTIQYYFEFDKWKGMSKKQLKKELIIAQLEKDTDSIHLLMFLLEKNKDTDYDTYNVNRKKHERILCPICKSNSHKIKGSLVETRECKQGHIFTIYDKNKNSEYKVL